MRGGVGRDKTKWTPCNPCGMAWPAPHQCQRNAHSHPGGAARDSGAPSSQRVGHARAEGHGISSDRHPDNACNIGQSQGLQELQGRSRSVHAGRAKSNKNVLSARASAHSQERHSWPPQPGLRPSAAGSPLVLIVTPIVATATSGFAIHPLIKIITSKVHHSQQIMTTDGSANLRQRRGAECHDAGIRLLLWNVWCGANPPSMEQA